MQLRLGNADTGVRDLEVQRIPLIADEYFETDLALIGELDRIVEQVHQHLPQLHRIKFQFLRHAGIDIDNKFQAF